LAEDSNTRGPVEGPCFVLTSLGCKVNQAEAAALAAALSAQGWRQAGEGEPCDAVVLLTCTVTGAAGRQSRQMARRLIKAHPGARVVVTGCDAQTAPAAYVKAGALVLGRAGLAGLADLIAGGAPASQAGPQARSLAIPLPAPDAGPWCPGARLPGQGRTRGLIKVQDGCDAGCAYCLVPTARGKPRSLPLNDAVAAWQAQGQAGAAEVVLTGVHLGRWGGDLTPPLGLTDLLRALLAAHPGPRLRLSSLEVSEVGRDLLALMAAEPRLCPHLHIPLQTGGDRLLGIMGRPYTAAQYAQALRAAEAALPGICLGADVMVGLPGEAEADYAATRELIASLPLAYLHVFPYSPRPGTPAAAMPERVPGPLARARAAELRALGQAKRLAFHQEQVGRCHEAVVEGEGLARTGNYCLARLDSPPPPGSLIAIEALGVEQTPTGPMLRARVV
jgi:threonylcarbamoyladenosine tRNA methylthiotransferase MtaB